MKKAPGIAVAVSALLIPTAIGLEYLAIIAGTAAGHGTSKDAAPFFYAGVSAAVGSALLAASAAGVGFRHWFLTQKFSWLPFLGLMIFASWLVIGIFAFFNIQS